MCNYTLFILRLCTWIKNGTDKVQCSTSVRVRFKDTLRCVPVQIVLIKTYYITLLKTIKSIIYLNKHKQILKQRITRCTNDNLQNMFRSIIIRYLNIWVLKWLNNSGFFSLKLCKNPSFVHSTWNITHLIVRISPIIFLIIIYLHVNITCLFLLC